MISATYYDAVRKHGVCQGTLWRQQEKGAPSSANPVHSTAERRCDYCVLVGAVLSCYENVTSYRKNDFPLSRLSIVGASAVQSTTTCVSNTATATSSASSSSFSVKRRNSRTKLTAASATNNTAGTITASGNYSSSNAASATTNSFRLVTSQGTHVYCQTPSPKCRDVWLAALYAGLEQALEEQPVPALLPAPEPAQTTQRMPLMGGAYRRYCRSCGAVDGIVPPCTPGGGGGGGASSGSGSTGKKQPAVIYASQAPLLHYGEEGRCDLCSNCTVAQGVLHHAEFIKACLSAAEQERQALQSAHRLIWNTISKASQQQQQQQRQTAHAEGCDNDNNNNNNNSVDGGDAPPVSCEGDGHNSNDKSHDSIDRARYALSGESTAESPPPQNITLQDEDNYNDDDTNSSWSQVGGAGSSSCMSDVSTNKTPSPPSPSSKATRSPLGGSESSPTLDSWHAVENPHQQQVTNWIQLPPTEGGTKALLEVLEDPQEFLPLARLSPVLASLSHELSSGRIGVPDFLEQLDEAAGVKREEEAEIMSKDSLAEMRKQALRVAGDMGTAIRRLLNHALPKSRDAGSKDHAEQLACILDFLLDLCEEGELASVAFFWPQLCHVHLLMLPARSYADLKRIDLMEDFLLTVACRHSIQLALELVWSHTADLEDSLSTEPCSIPCRRRRYSIIRFVCELESLLFDFDDGWGGGSVSLGKMFVPTGHQCDLLKQTFKEIQSLRKRAPECFLTRSVRLDRLSKSRFDAPPEEAAQEKFRIARNADYFSSHLNFTKRLTDIAAKLFFLEVDERKATLEQELALLNSSGAMGGDPLNKMRDQLVRVVRVPATEGHVFRSKERTPVLLLMEVIDEGADAEIEEPSKAENKTTAAAASEDSDGAAACGADIADRGDPSQAETILPPKPPDGHATDEEDRPPARRRCTSASGLKDTELSGSQLTTSPERIRCTSISGLKDIELNHSPCHPSALKRFSAVDEKMLEVSLTPKSDVEKLLTSAMVEKFQEKFDVPNLTVGGNKAPQTMEESQSVDEDSERVAKQESVTRIQASELTTKEIGSHAVESSGKESPPETSKQSKRISTLGTSASVAACSNSVKTLDPMSDIRREVLTAIMMTGYEGNTIALGAAASVMKSLKELECKRATELLQSDDEPQSQEAGNTSDNSYVEIENTRQKLVSLGLGNASLKNTEEGDPSFPSSEEDEVMESIRLLLIQNQVAQGHLSPADAAKVLQHVSLSRVNSGRSLNLDGSNQAGPDAAETIDAGDVDSRLRGCGPLPPAVLQGITLWKEGNVTSGELLELVKKDMEFVRHIVLNDTENVDKLNENSTFWGRFAFGERWAEKKSRIALSSPDGSTPGWDLTGCIIKANDDLRQEAFVMQLIELCQEAFVLAGLDLWVSPCRIVATGRTTGVIELLRNAMSFDALKKRPGYGKGGLREHMKRMTEFEADPEEAFKSAQKKFVSSLAAYSLMSYFFLFKDRHNGNIMLDTAGHVIHIDFGFVFGVAPGGSFSLELSTPFKLTEEMVDVMGGLSSPLFSEFVTLFCCGFLALQSYCETFVTIVEITSRGSTFKCFEGQETADVVSKLRGRFCTHLTKEGTVAFALDLIKQATTSYGTRQYDFFQYMSQGIAA